MDFGSWNINVTVGKYPQKIASAISDLSIVGASYTPIAYLGSQVVNGTNHAVLAEQILTTGKDTKNVVVMIFNERAEGVTLAAIERVVEQGGELGGTQVDVQTSIPVDALTVLNKALNDFVGSKIEPFALLGSQVVNGTNYIYAATLEPVVPNPVKRVVIIVVNDKTGEIGITDLLTDKTSSLSLGYAFTWLKSANTSI